MTVISAGVHTTAACLTYIIYYLNSNPSLLQKLRNELGSAFLDLSINLSLQKLEQLPYLTAAIQGGLRVT